LEKLFVSRLRGLGMREIAEFDHDKVRYIALKFKD
jgi:hypothetical protein